jgi:hypothetical protein
VKRRLDTTYRQLIVDPSAYGRGSRSMQDARAERRRSAVRIMCEPCGRRIDFTGTSEALELAYRIHEGRSDFDEHGNLILATSRTWRCRCGRSYPVTLERMRVEVDRAHQSGGVITLPLPRL